MKCFLVCSASQAFGGLGALRNVPQSYIIGCEVGRQCAFVARVLRPCCAFRGSTHGVTSLRFCAHTARRCPVGSSVGGGASTGLHTWRHIAQISRPHGAKMPWSAFCWGWGRSEGSTHGVTSLRFCAHTARRCPGVRSVGGMAFTGLHTSRHIAQILRPHGAKMPWSAFCWGWGVHRAPHMASHASHSASTRREDALECVLLGVGRFRGSTHGVTRVTFRVHTARRCPGVRSVGGRRVQRLHTWRHTRHIPRPHGPKMPCSAFCWGWGRSEAPHIASHRSDFTSYRPHLRVILSWHCLSPGDRAIRALNPSRARLTLLTFSAMRAAVMLG